MSQEYSARVLAINRALGIPADYAASRRLVLQIEARENALVVVATTPEGRPVSLAAAAAERWRLLQAAALDVQIALLPLSGFRGVARQEEIFRRKLGAGQSIADILRVNAAPGYSEHHTGRALDLGVRGEPPLTEAFAQTAAFAWLAHRAGEFGFHLSYPRDNPQGIAYEPWHWCWQP